MYLSAALPSGVSLGGVVDGGTGACRIQCEKGNCDSCARRRICTLSDVSLCAGRRFGEEDLVAGLRLWAGLGGVGLAASAGPGVAAFSHPLAGVEVLRPRRHAVFEGDLLSL